MKRLFAQLIAVLAATQIMAQGWPANYGGVMLQGFYWDSFDDTRWASLEKQASDLAASFDLIWIPQSANCGSQSMGYDDLYWFPGHYNSSFGSEQQLRSMIQTFKSKGLGTIADVVINHRKNVSSWVDFPAETYKGVTYELKSTDIVSDDDGGACLKWAKANGYELGNTEGASEAYGGKCEGWDGMRDLDHTSANVQKSVKAYLHMLLEDLGYAGFRYDMVKGYPGKYTGMYNSDANPQFSVGEFWDGNAATCIKWLEATKVNDQITSAAFDFPFRYTVRDAANGNTWSKLAGTSIITAPAYRQYAVTFVENHDTEYRSSTDQQDPLKKDTLAANAFMLALPGTPCVFLKHWLAYKSEIKAMIEARKLAGITNSSHHSPYRSNTAYYAASIDNKLLVVVGNESQLPMENAQWTKILSGYHYAYYLNKRVIETAWADKGSGDYTDDFTVTLKAVSATDGARLVYTLDGSEPTASNGQQVASGTAIQIGGKADVTLKVGLLIGTAVSGIITRTFTYQGEEGQQEEEFTIPSFCTVSEGEVCAFFEAPSDWSNTIYCWAWDSNNSNVNYTGGNWPGVSCTNLGEASNGNKVWKWTFNSADYKGTAGTATAPSHIIFNNEGQPQTADMSFVSGGYYVYDSKNRGTLKATVTSGIQQVTISTASLLQQGPVYTLDGRRVSRPQQHGIYIVNGKKFVK